MPALSAFPPSRAMSRCASRTRPRGARCGQLLPLRRAQPRPGAHGATPSTACPRSFCCAGCLAVAQTIDAAGLAGFYASRTESAVRLRGRVHRRMDAMGRDSRGGGPGARGRRGSLRSGAAARRPDLRRLRMVDRDVADAATGHRSQARINFANRRAIVAWNPSATRLFARVARSVGDRLPRASLRSRAQRGACAHRTARAAAAHGGGAAGDDAGDDVRASRNTFPAKASRPSISAFSTGRVSC